MTSSQAQPIQWSEYKHKKIESQLEGFWANDIWRPSENPLLGGKKTQGLVSLYFNRCVSSSLRTELKYACYIKVSTKEWGVTTLHGNDINTLIEAIGSVAPNTQSLLEYNQDVWKMYLRTYLVEQGKWQADLVSYINLDGQKVTYDKDDHRISCFTQFYKIIQDVYDDRDKYEKDVWFPRDFGKEAGRNSSPLRFTEIQQLWYKEAAKKFIKYSLSIRTWSSCYGRLDALKKFAEFTAKKYPLIQPVEINRQVMLDYYAYLSSLSISKSFYRSSVSYLRIFLQHCTREGWLDIPDKEMIYNDDLPKACYNKKIEQLSLEVRQIAFELDAQGVYPSSMHVSLHLTQPGCIRNKDVRAALYQVRRELGWEK